jgi:hypothetical protein
MDLENRPFILKTDYKNLTNLNITLTGKVLRWKLYLQDKNFYLYHVPGKKFHQGVPKTIALMREQQADKGNQPWQKVLLLALQPKQSLPGRIYDKIAAVHNSSKGCWGQRLTRNRLNNPSITGWSLSSFDSQMISRIYLQIHIPGPANRPTQARC